MSEGVRLQKVLAGAGIGSRRKCEILIERGRVAVNGAVVTELGTRVDPQVDVIHVDGVRVPTATDLVVVALNKPRGMLSTMSDDRGRPCVGDLVADYPQRLFHVGRLDADTEGLLLLTNDGELANRLGHPSHGVIKTYLATIEAPVPAGLGRRLRAGVELEDGPVQVDSFRVIQATAREALVELSLHEGRNRIVRRLLASQGRPVQALVRTVVGPIHLGQQRPGTIRRIRGEELRRLYSAAGL
jgi:23S rRNA pseudouridine2605 synthase